MDYPLSRLLWCAVLSLAFCPAVGVAAPGDDQYAVAAGHYSRSQWQMAVDEFRALLADHPGHARAAASRFYLGEALVQLGQFEQAHAAFDEFLRQSPDDPRSKQALFRVGETSYLAGRAEAAKRELEDFAQRFPDDQLNAYTGAFLGDLAIDAKDWETARRHYRLALEKFPAGSLADDCRYGLARALENLNDRPAAEQMFAEVAAKKSSGLSADAQYRLGSGQYARGDFAAAAATLHEFATTFPQHPLVNQAQMAEGWARYRLQEYPRAEEVFAAVAAGPTPPLEAQYWLGLTQKAQGNWSAAAETLRTAAADAGIDDLAAAIHFHAGEALLKAGNAKEADAEFARVTTSFPASPWADDSWLGRARAALASGNHSLVDHHAAHFAEHCPTSDKRLQVERVRADSLIARKQYAAAAALLEMLATEETDARAMASHQVALAVAYLGAGEPDDALALIENLPSETPSEIVDEAQLTRAQALVALARFAEAAPIVEQRMTHEKDAARLAVCRAQLAICCARTGDLARARNVYREFVACEPDSELLAATTTYLAEAAREAGDNAWSDELLSRATSDHMPVNYAAKALANRGRDEYRLGQFEQAAATLKRLIDEHPTHADAPQAALTRAQALARLNRNAESLEAYRWIVDKHPTSSIAPKALLGAARLNDQLQQDNESAELYERLVADYPKLSERDAVLYELAWVLNDLGKSSESERRFEQLRTEFPRSKLAADAAFRLAQRARERRDYDRASELLAETVSKADDAELVQHALYALGQLAATREAWADVRAPLDRLKRDYPESSLGLLADYWIAEAAYRQRNYDEAGVLFARLAKATTGRTDNWVALCALRRAQLAAYRSDWQEAQQLAERIAVEYPTFEQLYEVDYVLGRALAAQSKYDEARLAYRRVLESKAGGKTETAAMAQWMIGESFLNQKDYSTALKEFLRLEILYAYPTWQAGALLQAGKCQEMLGQSREASKLYGRVVKEYPETEFAAEAKTRLKAVGDAQAQRLERQRSSQKGLRL